MLKRVYKQTSRVLCLVLLMVFLAEDAWSNDVPTGDSKPHEDNAANLYKRAFELFIPYGSEEQDPLDARSGLTRDEWLEKNTSALLVFRKATQIDSVNWSSNNSSERLSVLTNMRFASRLLVARARSLMEAGHTEQAIDDVITTSRAAWHLLPPANNSAESMSFLVGLSMLELADRLAGEFDVQSKRRYLGGQKNMPDTLMLRSVLLNEMKSFPLLDELGEVDDPGQAMREYLVSLEMEKDVIPAVFDAFSLARNAMAMAREEMKPVLDAMLHPIPEAKKRLMKLSKAMTADDYKPDSKRFRAQLAIAPERTMEKLLATEMRPPFLDLVEHELRFRASRRILESNVFQNTVERKSALDSNIEKQ